MGNCLEQSRRGRAGGGGERCARKRAVWAEEKVAAAAAETEEEDEKCKDESESEPVTDQVKIRITRKQLEELVRRVDDGKQEDGVGGVPAREVVSELVCDGSSSSSNAGNAGAQGQGQGQGQWRPSLQSIPE